MSVEILLNRSHPCGGCFLSRQDATFLAGTSQEAARSFPTAQAVIDEFKPRADAGEHWAWNICYVVEDYIA